MRGGRGWRPLTIQFGRSSATSVPSRRKRRSLPPKLLTHSRTRSEDAVLSPVCNLGPGQTRSRGRPSRLQRALPKPRLQAADLAPPVEVAEMEKVHELHAPLLLVREAPARTPPARARRRGSVTVDRVVGALDARAAVGGGLGGHHIGGGRLPRAGVVGRGGPGVAGVKTAARAPPSSRRRGGVGSSAGRPHTVGTVHTRSYQKKGKGSTSAARELGTASGHPGGHLGTRGATRRGPGNISTPGPLTGVGLRRRCDGTDEDLGAPRPWVVDGPPGATGVLLGGVPPVKGVWGAAPGSPPQAPIFWGFFD